MALDLTWTGFPARAAAAGFLFAVAVLCWVKLGLLPSGSGVFGLSLIGLHLLAAAGMISRARWGAWPAFGLAVLWAVGVGRLLLIAAPRLAEAEIAPWSKAAGLAALSALCAAWAWVAGVAWRQARRRPDAAPRP